MSMESIRLAIVNAVSDIGKTYPTTLVIEYDNHIIVDTKTQKAPFLVSQVHLMDGEQADLSDRPIHRVYGQIHLAAAVREGVGRQAASQLLDFFYPKLQRRKFGPVRTKMAVPTKEVTHEGWVYYPVLIPFWSDLLP